MSKLADVDEALKWLRSGVMQEGMPPAGLCPVTAAMAKQARAELADAWRVREAARKEVAEQEASFREEGHPEHWWSAVCPHGYAVLVALRAILQPEEAAANAEDC